MARPIIDLDGYDDNGQPLFHVNHSAPDPVGFDARATDRQRQALGDFFGPAWPDATASQAHALLSYRNYGRLAAKRLAPRAREQIRHILAHFIVAIIAASDDVAADVVAWSERSFDRQRERANIAGTKHYQRIIGELEEHLAYLAGLGVDFMRL